MSRSSGQSEVKPPSVNLQARLVLIYRHTEGMKVLYEGDTRNRWRDGPVCPAVDKELWRLGPDSSAVRSAGCKCLPFLLVKSAREVPAFRFFPEKDKEEVSSVFTCNVKKRICQIKYYDEESVKCLLEGILEKKREECEEREKQEIKEYEERRQVRELKERQEARELKAGNRINELANVCILSGKHTAEVSEPVNKCRPLINPVVNKSVENATSRGFEKENCDPPVRGKEFNVNRSSDCDVKMKVGICEGRVKTVAMGAQRVINPVNIGVGSFELKRDKGVANPEGLICENSCAEKYTLGTLNGCEKKSTVDQGSFRNYTIAKIAGQGGKENMCKADVRKSLENGLAMRLPLSGPSEIYKDSLETDNGSNFGSECSFEIDLPGKRDRSTIYRLNLIKLYRRKPELANLVMKNSSEGIDSETLYSVKLFMDVGFQGYLRKSQLYFKLPPDRSSYLRMINAKKKERFLHQVLGRLF
ncbi:uncharacterized protein TNCV_2342361 [Trichonephila clavipes]|nr:uncharacterized protein TNCV_2342361 [Trichonephila clavipes]